MQGIEKQIDELGRVVLPIKFRKKLGLQSKATVLVSLEDDTIMLTPFEKSCALCGSRTDIHKNFRLCAFCVAKIRQEE